MSSITIPVELIFGVAAVGLHASTAKFTKICDVKTAAVYATANQAAQLLYVSLAPASQDLAVYIGLGCVVGYLGGSLATTVLCQRTITVKEAVLLTTGSMVQGAILGGIIGGVLGGLGAWMADNQFAGLPMNATA